MTLPSFNSSGPTRTSPTATWGVITLLTPSTTVATSNRIRGRTKLAEIPVNLVSLGAAFGFLVLFWQDGHGSNLIYGVPATGSIRNWIPIVAFAFLFGLSMDYEVFILARMREEYDRTGSTKQAVVGSLAHTGRLVTCAALILAISFASLTTNSRKRSNRRFASGRRANG